MIFVTVYQLERKKEIAKAMDVPWESLDLRFAFWDAIRAAYDRCDLIGTRALIEKLTN